MSKNMNDLLADSKPDQVEEEPDHIYYVHGMSNKIHHEDSFDSQHRQMNNSTGMKQIVDPQ